jgi:hypothetical protein
MGGNEKRVEGADSCVGGARDSGERSLFFTICSKVGK